MTSRRPSTRSTLVVAGALGAVVAVAGCGGSTPVRGATAQSTAGAGRGQNGATGGRGGFGGFGGPGGFGAFGTAAEIDGHTIQVQNQVSGQTAVTFSAATTFRRTVAASAADVKPGVCVVVQPVRDTSGSASTSAPGSPVTAAAVSISQAVNGTCTRGGRAGRGSGTGTPGTAFPRPSNRPTGAPSDRPGGFRGFGAFGTVRSVSGSTFVVSSMRPGTTSAVSTTVTTTAATTYTKTIAATAKALAVGECLTATGRPDSTGTVAAASIDISRPVNGQCSFGFGQGGPRDGNGGAANG